MNQKVKKSAKSQVEGAKVMAEKANTMVGEMSLTLSLKDGTEVDIYKCRAKNVGRVMDFIAFVMKEMNIENFGEMPSDVDFTDPKLLLPLLTKAASRIIYLSADLCSLNHEEVSDLELDDMIILVTRQFEVNKGFFLKNVLPSARIDLKG